MVLQAKEHRRLQTNHQKLGEGGSLLRVLSDTKATTPTDFQSPEI